MAFSFDHHQALSRARESTGGHPTVPIVPTVLSYDVATVGSVGTVGRGHAQSARPSGWLSPPGLPAEWREGLESFDADKPPNGIEAEPWAAFVTAARRIAETGTAAVAFVIGWEAADLFGLHPGAPLARHDVKGLAFMLRPADVVEHMHDTGAVIRRGATGTRHSWRREEDCEVVPMWRLVYRAFRHRG
jgi:hypothetical protein